MSLLGDRRCVSLESLPGPLFLGANLKVRLVAVVRQSHDSELHTTANSVEPRDQPPRRFGAPEALRQYNKRWIRGCRTLSQTNDLRSSRLQTMRKTMHRRSLPLRRCVRRRVGLGQAREVRTFPFRRSLQCSSRCSPRSETVEDTGHTKIRHPQSRMLDQAPTTSSAEAKI